MAWSQQDLETLKSAMARGVKRVTLADQTTEFHDLGEMRKLLAQMQREVNSPRTHRLAVISKGT